MRLEHGWLRRSTVAFALAAGLSAVASAARAQAPVIPDDVKASIRTRVDYGYHAGIIAALLSPTGTTYFAYGTADSSGGSQLNENSVFEIGSITKVFTAILLADMVRRGEVSLDDPVSRYLPPTVGMPTRNGRVVTLLDLVTHTSGLPRLPDNFAPGDSENPYADYSVERMYAFLSGHTLRRDIGSEYEYSNLGMGLLGHVLALRAGTTYEALVKARITDVLGMTSTGITLTPDMRHRLAQGHVGTSPVASWDIPTLAGAGALRSTARDMVTFVRANMGLLGSPLYPVMRVTHEPRHRAGLDIMQVGLAWHIRTQEARTVVWHNGGTGGYRSFVGFLPDSSAGVVVLTNSNLSADDIGLHLLDPTLPLRNVPAPVSVDPAVLARYVGRYALGPFAVFEVTAEGRKLLVQLAGQQRFEVFPSSETEFFYTVVDARITFVVDAQGRATTLILHQGGRDMTAQRIP